MTFPPSLAAENKLKTHTYIHCPDIDDQEVIVGVDEAGRGPVLGPMVYAAAFCSVGFKEQLATLGFADSKILNEEQRMTAMENIVNDEVHNTNIGWATTVMTAKDISEGMLRPGMPYNLNAQAHDTTIELIKLILSKGYKVSAAYIDTVGPPEKYQSKLSNLFPSIKFTVAKKADSLFPIVSCASICAKVTRDCSLRDQLCGCGSGYPSDPNTVKWLKSSLDPLHGWGDLVRYSWGTAKDMLDKAGHLIEWPEEQSTHTIDVLGKSSLNVITLASFGYM